MAPPELRVIAAAVAAGAGWGLANALIVWRFRGSEIIFLEAFLFVPAWLFGRAVGRPGPGALAGLAYVGVAVAVYELLPMWGLEARSAGAFEQFDEEILISGFDAEDIMLFSTMAVGAIIGFGGGLWRREAVAVHPEGRTPETQVREGGRTPQTHEAPAPDPLWAEGEPEPDAVREEGRTPETQVPVYPPHAAPVASSALLVAALATDIALGVLFEIWTDPQMVVAGGFGFVAIVAGVVAGRRYAIAAIVVGVLMACAFAGVQEWEYQQRLPDVTTAFP